MSGILKKADLRYHCVTMAVAEPILGLDYLRALAKHYEVQACPIGPAFLAAPPWSQVSDLFLPKEFDNGFFINVVCAPVDMMAGQTIRQSDLAPDTSVPGAKPASSDVVYRPSTVFGALFTVGVMNIAITLPTREPSEAEQRVLTRYSAIWTPTESARERLRAWGIHAQVVVPETLQKIP